MRYRSSIAPRTSKIGWMFLMLMGVVMIVILYSIKAKTLAVKTRVDGLELKLTQEQQAVHVLAAEIAHLQRPGRLRVLAEKQLGLQPTPAERALTLGQAVQRLQEDIAKAEGGSQ